MINNIIQFELKKVYLNIRVWAILLICVVCNAYLYFNVDEEFDSKCYMKLKDHIISNQGEVNLQYEEYNEYTLNIVLNEYFSVLDVPLFVDYVLEASEKSSNVSLFSHEDNVFSVRNIMKTEQDYAKLEGINVTFGGTYGLSKALDFYVTDICLFILITICIYYIFMDEQKSEIIYVSNCTSGGRTKKCISQWCSVVVTTTGLVFLLYGINIILSVLYTGTVDMNLPIQALYGYDKSSFSITIGEYIAGFFLIKSLNCIFVASFIFYMAILTKNDLFFYFGIGLIIVVNMLMNNVQNLWGIKGYFKHCNLIYIFSTTSFFKNYYNLDVFNWPISHYIFNIVLCILVILLIICGSCIAYTKKNAYHIFTWQDNKSMCEYRGKRYYTKLFLYEVKKGLVGSKLLLLIICLGIFSYFWYTNSEKNLSSKEIYYLYYVNQSCGMSTEELYYMNITEQKKIDEYKQEIITVEKDYSEGEITEDEFTLIRDYYTQLLQCEGGFYEWQKQYRYIEKYNSKNVEQIYLINNLGWRKAFGIDNKSRYNYKIMYVIILIILLPMLCVVFLGERTTEMQSLNNSTKKGRLELMLTKFKFCMLISCVVALIVFISYLCFLNKIYGLSEGFSNVASIPLFEQFSGINILALLTVTILIRLLIIQCIAITVCFVIRKTNNFIVAMIMGGCIILLFSIIILL